MVRASERWMPALSGFGSGPTALTNARRPSASRSRTASPGENPPGWVTASTTVPPSRAATSSRSQSGTPAQATRCPVAGGTTGRAGGSPSITDSRSPPMPHPNPPPMGPHPGG